MPAKKPQDGGPIPPPAVSLFTFATEDVHLDANWQRMIASRSIHIRMHADASGGLLVLKHPTYQDRTYAIEHNPNCARPFLARLPGAVGKLDRRDPPVSVDICGYGMSQEEAMRGAVLQSKRDRDECYLWIVNKFPPPWRAGEDGMALFSGEERVAYFPSPEHARIVLEFANSHA
jgi:hypothetical protein